MRCFQQLVNNRRIANRPVATTCAVTMTTETRLYVITLVAIILLSTAHGASFGHDVGAVTGSSPRTGYACEGSTLSITCAENARVVIQRANYGRFTPSICNDGRSTEGWDMQCMSTRSLSIVMELCDGRIGRCDVFANNRLFGEPCSLTPKYLEVQYRCEVPQPATSPSTSPRPLLSDIFGDDDEEEVEYSETTAGGARISMTTTVPTSPTTKTGKSSIAPSSTASPVSSASTESVQLNDGPQPQPIRTAIAFCEPNEARDVMWPRTAAGTTVELLCPNNEEVRGAVWYCGTDPVDWVGKPDLSRCISPSIANIKALADDTREQFSLRRLEILAEDLVAFTDMEEDVYGGDLTELTVAMQETIDQIEEHFPDIPTPVAGNKSSQIMQKVNDAILTTSSYLLDDERVDSWLDLPQATQAETATRLISTVENSAYQVAKKCEQPTVIVNVTVNIVMEIKVVDVSGLVPVEDAVFPKVDPASPSSWGFGGDSIRLTGETIRQLGVEGLAKMIFATYSNLDRYLHQPQNDDSNIIRDVKTNPTPSQPSRYYTDNSLVGKSQPAYKILPDRELNDVETDVMTVSYDSDRLSDDLTGKTVNTKIISASFGDRSSTEHIQLKDPVIYTLEHLTKDNVFNPSCSFWEFSEKSISGKWSTFGCQIVDTNLTHTTCACQHLTNFAVLMSLKTPNEKLSMGHEFTLSLMTYCGCVLSIVCLVAAFCSFQFFKNLQCDRNTIHKNLVASLLVAEVVFLFGIVQYQNSLLCSVIAGILQYLFLAAFAWMCLEGVQIYIMLVEVFEVEKSRVGWFYAAGYGVPAIIVATSASIYPDGYGTPYHCWLKTDHGFMWSFVGPVCAIIFVNVIMLSIAMYVMCRHASSSAAASWKTKDMSKLDNARAWIKGAVVLIVLLGPTWIIGIFYVNNQWVVMAYLFTIFNSLQGVFIFVCHCLMNEKVIKEYKRWVRHTSWMPSNLRMRCGGTKATTPSTTPNNSSSSGVNYLTRLLSNRRRKRSSTSTLPSTTNIVKRNGYMIQRNSSGRDSAHLTDSGIACCHNDAVDGDSHIYSEPTTEDPSAYLDPVRIRLDPDEEMNWLDGDMSMMEGSVADTDYMDDFGRRGPVKMNAGAAKEPQSPGSINIDNYKIRPPPPTVPLPDVPAKVCNQYQSKPVPSGVPPVTSSKVDPLDGDVYRSDESLLRRKLLALGETTDDYNDDAAAESSICSSTSTLMLNNLNKGSGDCESVSANDDSSGLSAPNITKNPPQPHASTRDVPGRVNRALVLSLQRSLPSLCPPDAESAMSPTENSRAGNPPICVSVGCALDVVSCDGNSPVVRPRLH